MPKTHSETTKANKVRKAEVRAARLLRAAERRTSDSYTYPMNAMLPTTELPRKERDRLMKFHSDRNESVPEMVPHPLRGERARGKIVGDAITRRIEQAKRVQKKARSRKRLQEAKASSQPKSRRRA